ncbi:hypothetical protein C2W62_01115 [Candidatus Entotheonella serta]|nr:hypothetical protein C2W62_01115 [Candidatus Entotheonella serta]
MKHTFDVLGCTSQLVTIRQPALETEKPVGSAYHHGVVPSEAAVVNELDAAYEAIPVAEREAWCRTIRHSPVVG